MNQSGIGLSDLRKNFTKSGLFVFFAGARREDDASSDEEQALQTSEDESFIKFGHRGIVVLKCHCLKSDRQKILHIHLYSGQLYQYTNGKRKISQTSDICGILVRADFTVVVDVRRNRGILRKIYAFDSLKASSQYQRYIEFRNDTGIAVRNAFDEIDRRGAKLITAVLLKIALKSMDILASEGDVKAM